MSEHNARALDQLLLERFGGKVGRGMAVESLFAPVLTACSKDSENPPPEQGIMSGANISLQ